MTPARIALLVPGLASCGGVTTVAGFLYEVLERSGRYHPELISLAISARDESSVRLASPSSWFRGVKIASGDLHGRPFLHAGCYYSELEFQRYQPRSRLKALLDQYDLIQVVAGTPAWALAARNCTPPVLLQVASLAREERKSKLSSGVDPWRSLMTRITNRLDIAALRTVRLAFVENLWMLHALGRTMGPSRVVFCPPGIDSDRFQPGAYRPNGYCLSVARFTDPRKNVRLLLDAYARFRALEPDAPRLVLAGLTGLTEEDRQFSEELGLTDHVEIRQGVSQKELAEVYRGASLFLLSSDEEGLGLVLLEAMACGVPVIATRCGGAEVSVADGENGLLTPVGDPEAFCERMRELWRDPDRRRRMGESGRRTVEVRFSFPVAGKRFLEAYDQIIERPKSGIQRQPTRSLSSA